MTMSRARLLRKHPDIKYKIVGDHSLRNDVAHLVAKLNIADRLRMFGWRTQEEVWNS